MTVGFISEEEPAAGGRKGGIATDPALWIGVAFSVKQVSGLLATAIQEWCATERNRRVRVTRGEDSIEISGRPDRTQERMVREFLDVSEADE